MTASPLPAIIAAPAIVIKFTEGERRVFRPKEKLTVSQWASKYRVVTNGPITGKWRNEVTPYLVSPMDAMGLSWIRMVALCFAPQTGKTQVGFNFMCRCIDQEPGPAMYVMPDEKIAKRISRRRIIPMFRGTPRIAELMSPRADDTTITGISFKNGMDIMMAWASSVAEISSESIRYLIKDEIDKPGWYGSGKETNHSALADIRTNTYPDTKKILNISTPTDESGNITQIMKTEVDVVFRFWAKCPICGEHQIMEFDNIVWPKSARNPKIVMRKKLAEYQCTACGMLWDDHRRNLAVRQGEWRLDHKSQRPEIPMFWDATPNEDEDEAASSVPATPAAPAPPEPIQEEVVPPISFRKFVAHCEANPAERPQSIGFHYPSWGSPFISLSAVAAAFLRGLEDPEDLKIFVTQHKAEPWKLKTIPKKESAVLAHKTDIPPLIVPAEAVALTCGVDSQKDHFWFVVRAWANDLTSWLIQYGMLASFDDIESLIYRTRYLISGSTDTMEIWRTGIDTGGSKEEDKEWTRTEEIYQWLRNQEPGRVYGIRGASQRQINRIKVTTIDQMPRTKKPIPGGLELRLLATEQFKELIHFRLDRKKEESQQFFLHSETGEDYAKQLLAEELTKDIRGNETWKRIRRANHLLDCEVIAHACADASWIPSLQMLAVYLENEKERLARASQGQQSSIARSNWMSRK